jgi:polyhydroxyalkanoate synthesis regulator phasin
MVSALMLHYVSLARRTRRDCVCSVSPVKAHCLIVAVLPLALLAAAGCEPPQQPPANGTQPTSSGTLGRLVQDLDRVVDRAGEVAREQSTRFIDEAQLRLRQMRQQLEDAEKREDLSEEARARFRTTAARLREDIRNLEGQLEGLRGRGAEAWRDAAPRLRQSMQDLGATFDRFRQEYLRTQARPADSAPPELTAPESKPPAEAPPAGG